MPDPTGVPELDDALKQFAADHEAFVASREGLRALAVLKAFSRGVRAAGMDAVLGKNSASDARTTIAWLSRMPQVFLGNPKAPFIDLERMEPKAQSYAVAAALQVLAVGSKALLLGGSGKDGDAKHLPLAVLHVAFGADSAASALRTAMADPRWPLPSQWKWPDTSRLAELVLAGTLGEMLQTFARCGVAAQNDRSQRRLLVTYGHVDSLTQPRACGGHSLDVAYSGFGNAPAPGSDVLLTVPTRGGCVHFAFSRIAPGLLSPGGWQSSGVVRVTLPDNVYTGAVGFFLMPPPVSTGGCEAGSLAGAAGMLQSVLGEVLGPGGVLTGQVILNVANHVEAARLESLPCASRQNDDRNWLLAGAPVIDRFALVNTGPVHPGNTVTLEWAVDNADRVTIVPRDVADSESQHELPPVPHPLPTSGRITLPLTCTTRWEAEYVLEATNGNGCPGTPATRAVPVRSGFSHWRLGVGRADITDRRPGLPMAGFAYKQQTSSGEVQRDAANNEMPLMARAFYIGENRLVADRRELVIVVADMWTCTIAVKQAVVAALNMRFAPKANGDPRFTDANVMIAGTHTHAAPGGYSHYALYNLTVRGFDEGVFGTIVNGIASAAGQAVDSAQTGRLFAINGDVPDCGVNRSMPAFERNPEAAAGEDPLDRSMLLLKLVTDTNNRGGSTDIGAVNWYAMHPTSLGMYNRVISGDNKGWAEMLFESEMARRGKRVVAAFGNANAADVSGNYVRNASGDPEFRRPLGGVMPEGGSFPPRFDDPADTAARDCANMQAIGQKQYAQAIALFDDKAAAEVTGRLHLKHAFVDMSNVAIDSEPNARTWPAALGVSFGAGSSEDSIAYATMDGFDIDANIPEGVTLAVNVLGGVSAVAAVAGIVVAAPAALPQLPLLLATIFAGAPMPAALVRFFLPLAAALLFAPSRAFIAARVAAATLPDEIPFPHPDHGSGWWFLPTFVDYESGYETGHGEKPIMFPVGLAEVNVTPAAGSALPALDHTPCPLVPHVVPMHLVRIGSVVLAGVPAEFTATAGRRLKQTLATAFGGDMSHCAIAGYCNGYSGYVTTREEYAAQHYEGASTLYGEFTLMAYQQTFSALAAAVNGGSEVAVGAPFSVPLVVRTGGARP